MKCQDIFSPKKQNKISLKMMLSAINLLSTLRLHSAIKLEVPSLFKVYVTTKFMQKITPSKTKFFNSSPQPHLQPEKHTLLWWHDASASCQWEENTYYEENSPIHQDSLWLS